MDENNLVFTSGKDGVFYEGISVGQVVLEDDKFKVKLFADPNQLQFVNVVLDKILEVGGN